MATLKQLLQRGESKAHYIDNIEWDMFGNKRGTRYQKKSGGNEEDSHWNVSVQHVEHRQAYKK